MRNTGSRSFARAQLHQLQSAAPHPWSVPFQLLCFNLFVCNTRPLCSTAPGEILFQLAEQVLPQIQQALQTCHEPHLATLRLAIECHSCIQWLTPAPDNFRQRWPQVVMDFKSGVPFHPQPALQQGELDLVLTSVI
ncbi:LysR substrate-binding domain-containing protein, partial [Serratia quinivorans]